MSDTKKHESLGAALAAFQAEYPTVAKENTAVVNSSKGSYKYDYADLSDISPVVLPLLGKHGLYWTTRPTVTDGNFALLYSLGHESGQSLDGIYPLPAANTPAQQMGGAITYARRYALCAVTGIAPGGDDTDAHQPAPQQMRPDAPAEWRADVAAIPSKEAANAFWQRASADGWLTPEVQAALTERVAKINKEAANVAGDAAQAE